MPNGKKKKGHKMATHKRKKRLRLKELINRLSKHDGACHRRKLLSLEVRRQVPFFITYKYRLVLLSMADR